MVYFLINVNKKEIIIITCDSWWTPCRIFVNFSLKKKSVKIYHYGMWKYQFPTIVSNRVTTTRKKKKSKITESTSGIGSYNFSVFLPPNLTPPQIFKKNYNENHKKKKNGRLPDGKCFWRKKNAKRSKTGTKRKTKTHALARDWKKIKINPNIKPTDLW